MNDEKDSITIFNSFPVFPPVSGGQQRVYYLAKSLSPYYNIRVLTISNRNTDNDRFVSGDLSIKNIPQMALLPMGLLSRIFRLPISETFLPKTSRLLRGFIEEAKSSISSSSVIICERPYLFGIVSSLRRGKLLVYDAHDIEADIKKDVYSRWRLFNGPIMKYITEHERIACNESDIVVVVSEDNKKRYIDLYGIPESKIAIVPNGVNLADIHLPSMADKEMAKNTLGLRGCKVITFIGSPYYPNREAASFIVSQVAPRLADCQFLIVGNLGINQQSIQSNNAKVLGFVDEDMKRTVLAATDIAINPIFHGSGTNLKMLEYMAWGIPVVTTSMGARGLNIEDNRNVMISTGEDFSKTLVKILSDEALCKTIGQGGRELTEKYYDWDSITKRLVETLQNNRPK